MNSQSANVITMRDEQVIEAELMEISTIQDDTTKFERIIAWCAAYPEEIPVALRFFRQRLNHSERVEEQKK